VQRGPIPPRSHLCLMEDNGGCDGDPRDVCNKSDCSSTCVVTWAPYDVNVQDLGWQAAALASLKDNGFCALRGKVLPVALCARLALASADRVESLLPHVTAKGFNVRNDRIRFTEICSRDQRVDFSVPNPNKKEPAGRGALSTVDEAAWAELHAEAHRWVWPLLQGFIGDGDDDTGEGCVVSSGCVIALPESIGQRFHPDGNVRGMFNVFMPLVRVTPENGPTEFQRGSQVLSDEGVELETAGDMYDDAQVPYVAPCLEAGEVLIFDYRVWHRGLGNSTATPRPVGYLVYTKRGFQDDYTFPASGSVFDE